MEETSSRQYTEITKDYSSAKYEQGNSLVISDLAELYFRPTIFFTSKIAIGKTPYLILISLILGISQYIEKIDQELIRFNFGNPKPGMEQILPYVVDSWLNFWVAALVLGSISGYFVWAIGGWWYKVRLKWSGAIDPEPKLSRIIYIYASFVAALPAVLLVVAQTLFFNSYRSAFNADEFYSLLILIFPFWSIVTSYKAVNSIFDLNKTKAKIWFLILPFVVFILALGIFATLGALFLNN